MNSSSASLLGLFLLICGCTSTPHSTYTGITLPPGTNEFLNVLPVQDVQWEQLNPARGDKSPAAGTLWGHRKHPGLATGFLATFVDGFSSPPHIHNRTYRAVVLEGLIHNDDPSAEKMWMPPGSFWTQPKGEVHITASKGRSMALVEINQGPYLVQPVEEAYDSGERPVNVVPDNLMWTPLQGDELTDHIPQQALLWGSLKQGALRGSFLKLPHDRTFTLRTDPHELRLVIVKGSPTLIRFPEENQSLDPGSSISSKGPTSVTLATEEETILYIRSTTDYELKLDL